MTALSIKSSPTPTFVDVSDLVGYSLGLEINSIDDENPWYWRSVSENIELERSSFLQGPNIPLKYFFTEKDYPKLPQHLIELSEDLGFFQFNVLQAALVSKEAYQLADSAPLLFVILVYNYCKHEVSRDEFCALVQQPRRVLLEFCGLPATKSFLKFLKKLQVSTIPAVHFERFLGFVANNVMVRQLRHVQEPCFNHLFFIAGFRGIAWPNLLCLINKNQSRADLAHIARLAEDTLYMANDDTYIHSIRSYDELRAVHDQLVVRRNDALRNQRNTQLRIALCAKRYGEYPLPPIAGNEVVLPISSWADLIYEGLEMRHCVSSYDRQIAAGDTYVYKGIGEQRLTISVIRQNNGWSLSQVYGVCNSQPSKEAKEQVLDWFQSNYLGL